MRILIVDAEAKSLEELSDELRSFGHEVIQASTGRDALRKVRAERPLVVFTDARLPDFAGNALLTQLKAEAPSLDVIVLADVGDPAEAVAAIKAGATDYLTRPVPMEELAHELQQIAERRAVQSQYATARRTTATPMDKMAIVGRSEPILRLFQRMERVAASGASVLIKGESGTGKELVARWLHQRSQRAGGPFVAVNCAALPDTLLEAELFGHEKGAYTGAARARKGRFQLAHGGTLFLDEVAEIPLPAQAKLLRVIQEGEIEPLGGQGPISVDVRILSATHRDLKQRIADGLFREDLFYRLKVLDLVLPPLRQRPGDLPLLVEHFLKQYSPPGVTLDITPRAWAAIAAYDYPGNVRELSHAVQHAVVLVGDDEIDLFHLPDELLGAVEPESVPDGAFASLSHAVREFEQDYMRRALVLADGNKTRAARILNIERKTLYRKLERMKL